MGNVKALKKFNLFWFPLSSIALKNVLDKDTDQFLNISDTEICIFPFRLV